MVRKALLILGGNAMASLLSLLRNLLIARLLPVEDYGIAATFALVMTLAEMASNIGLQAQIVQDEHGDEPGFQASLQGFQVLRGILAALGLFAAGGLVADFLNLPDLGWAYRTVALIPLINGFTHFDIYRLNRSMRFLPLMLFNALPVAITLIILWPTYLFFEDWRVMLALLICQSALMTAVSHLASERRYRLRLDRTVVRKSIAFGWPLLVNNAMLFLVFQGDRVLVTRELGAELLAIFSMGVTLTLTPTLVMSKSLQNLLLPRLSAETDAGRFDALALASLQAAILSAAALLVGVHLLAAPMIDLVLGAKYLDLIPLIGGLAAVQALRVLKIGPNTVALSRGHTKNTMISNAFRVATLPVVWIALSRGSDLHTVVALGAIGEAAGYGASLVLLRYRLGQRLRPVLLPCAALLGLLVIVSGLGPTLPPALDATLVLAFAVLTIATASAAHDMLMKLFARVTGARTDRGPEGRTRDETTSVR